MKEKFYTIYQITNLINGMIYIGFHSTTNPNDSYMGSSKYLKKDIKEFGKVNFQKEILFIFDNSEEMIEKEIELVNDEFVSRDDTYNKNIGGDGISNLGKPINEKQRLRLSKIHTGRKHTEETKDLIREKRKLQIMTEETRQKMSDSRKGKPGKPRTQEQKDNHSRIMKGRSKPPRTEEHKRKLSECKQGDKNPMFGKSMTKEHKEIISNATKGRKRGPQSEEHKRKLSESRKGKRTVERNKELKKLQLIRKVKIVTSLLFGIINFKQTENL